MKSWKIVWTLALVCALAAAWPALAADEPVPVEEPAANAAPAPNVWWGNQGRAFGNYLKIEGAPLKQARPVPPPVDRATILFDKGKAVITPAGAAELDRVSTQLQREPQATVALEGHSTDMPSAGQNMDLGQRRADTVKMRLVEGGVAPNRVKAKSLGDTKPATQENTPADKKLNQRVVAVVKH